MFFFQPGDYTLTAALERSKIHVRRKGVAAVNRPQKILVWLRRLRLSEVNIYSAYASYFIVLSMFPAMMLIISLLPYTPVTERELQTLLERVVPASLRPLLDYMIEELFAVDSAAALSVSAVMALWIASKGVYSLQRGLNKVYGARETRSFLLVRLRCVGFTLLLLAALLLTGAIHLAGKDLAASLAESPALPAQILLRIIRLRTLVTAVILSLLFLGLYCIFPNRRVCVGSALPGAFCTAVLWMVFSRLFSRYVDRFGNYSLYYGSLSVMALAMLWIYSCMYLLLCGGILNRELERLRNRKRYLNS